MNAEPRDFVDTNVLVYMYDSVDAAKRQRATRLISELGETGRLTLSTQVLQELYITLSRKLTPSLDVDTASGIVGWVAGYRTHCPSPADVLAAIDLSVQSRISFWDAMLVRSASRMGCNVLWTEDLTHGQVIADVEVRNPFLI
jgi:predicted nucleic acid-binding protein